MIIPDAWDVVVVPFPFTDAPHAKPRPVVIISKRHFNAAAKHCWCLMITTAQDENWPADTPLSDLTRAGLDHSSVVRMKSFTLDSHLIKRHIGSLANADRKRVKAALAQVQA